MKKLNIFSHFTYKVKKGFRFRKTRRYRMLKKRINRYFNDSISTVTNLHTNKQFKKLCATVFITAISFNVGIIVQSGATNQGSFAKTTYAMTPVELNYVNASMIDTKVKANLLSNDMEEQTDETIEQKDDVPSKTIDELVNDVETGKAGNGQDRINYLGDKYDEVMEIINEKYKEEEKQKVKAVMATSGDKATYQQYARDQFDRYGWSDSDFECLIKLWTKESNWNPSAHNKSSGAHGIAQALPASKMASYGDDYMTSYQTQINWGLDYIKNRYGAPSNAWKHFQEHNWY